MHENREPLAARLSQGADVEGLLPNDKLLRQDVTDEFFEVFRDEPGSFDVQTKSFEIRDETCSGYDAIQFKLIPKASGGVVGQIMLSSTDGQGAISRYDLIDAGGSAYDIEHYVDDVRFSQGGWNDLALDAEYQELAEAKKTAADAEERALGVAMVSQREAEGLLDYIRSRGQELLPDMEKISPLPRTLKKIETAIGSMVNDFEMVADSAKDAVVFGLDDNPEYSRMEFSIFPKPSRATEGSSKPYDIAQIFLIGKEEDFAKLFRLVSTNNGIQILVSLQSLGVESATANVPDAPLEITKVIKRALERKSQAAKEERELGLDQASEKDAQEVLTLLTDRGEIVDD